MTILSAKDLAGLRELAETRKKLDVIIHGEKILCIEVDRFLRLIETAEFPTALLEALQTIKGLVVGDRAPRWSDPNATTATRGAIADIVDSTLARAAINAGASNDRK